MKVEKKPEPFYIFGYLLGLTIKSGNLKNKSLENLENLVKNPLYRWKSYFSD
jgi:hypothetical protein